MTQARKYWASKEGNIPITSLGDGHLINILCNIESGRYPTPHRDFLALEAEANQRALNWRRHMPDGIPAEPKPEERPPILVHEFDGLIRMQLEPGVHHIFVRHVKSRGDEKTYVKYHKAIRPQGMPNRDHEYVPLCADKGGASSATSWEDPCEDHNAAHYRGQRVILQNGSMGGAVRCVQRILGLQPTGFFNTRIECEVRRFQRYNGLVPDGLVGPLTWRVLMEREHA